MFVFAASKVKIVFGLYILQACEVTPLREMLVVGARSMEVEAGEC